MDWFLHFFQGLLFLSPSRWMVIAPPVLIMCWIGKKTGGKRFYGNWESIPLEVGLLQLHFSSHHKSSYPLPPYRGLRAPVSERMMAALITLMASWKIGHRGWKMVGKKLNSGVQVAILPSEWWLWQETKRRIIVSSRLWLPSLPFFSMNKEHFTICISWKFLVGGWQDDALKPFTQLINMHEACKWQTRMVLYIPSMSYS